MKKIIKMLFLINFLAVTLVSVFLFTQISMSKSTTSMYSVENRYKYLGVKTPIFENKEEFPKTLKKIKNISKV